MSARRHVLQTIRWCDRLVDHAKGPRRVLVEVRSPMNLEVLRPMWSSLLRDKRVELTFTSEANDWVRPQLEAEGLVDRLVPQSQAMWARFDLAINADPWNALSLRRCWKRANFFHGVAGKYDLDDAKAIGQNVDFRIYDRIMFANDDRMRKYVDGGIVQESQAALVGFPKTDALVNGEWSAATVRAGLGLDPSLETVLYAPTFSPASSLHLCGEAIIATLLGTGRNLIVKLHERSTVPHPKYTGNIDWLQRLDRFERHPRYVYAKGAHAGPYLAAADLLVTDHSTIGFEFALLDRPLVVVDAPDLLQAARINPDKWHQLRSMADVARDASELPDIVDRALREPWRHAAKRQATSAALFAHAGQATVRALDVLYELLDLRRMESRIPHASDASGMAWSSSEARIP